jgi:hypothetical protein
MLRVPVFTSSFGIITTNSLPRNRNVTGNVALLVDLRYANTRIMNYLCIFIPTNQLSALF